MSSSIPAESTSSGADAWSRTPATMPTLVVGERRRDPLEEVRLADDVVVHEHEHVAVELERGAVDRRAEAEVALVADDAHVRDALGDRLGRAVGRGVVDDDNVAGTVCRSRLSSVRSSRSRPSSVGMTTHVFTTVELRDRRTTDVLRTGEAGGKVIRGGALRGAGYAAGILLGAGTSVLLLRHLGVEDFGRYGIVIALLGIVSAVTDAGPDRGRQP